jgi:para-nitrobenzyl esterase
MIPQKPIVQTGEGSIQGSYEDGVAVFKGVAYAAPPVHSARWQPPQPPLPIKGLYQAEHYSASAPQNPSSAARFKEFVVEGPQNEDCLYLNIWTPAVDNALRPVMVWIHGGLFTMGSGSQSAFTGCDLAKKQGVVVVTLNYRLGLLGFLNLAEVSSGRLTAGGNEGLQDQIAALKWLKTNIAAFGGNPDNITLFGESAGGAAIACLMCMPAAQGLFHKAVMQSNIWTFISREEAAENARRVLAELEISEQECPKLLKLPVERLLAVQQRLTGGKTGKIRIGPVIDGRHLPGSPLAIFRDGGAAGIPLLAGTNLEETRLFRALNREREEYNPAVAEKIRLQTEALFRRPTLAMLEAHCCNRRPGYAYLFRWQSPALKGALGACHGLEIGFIFGTYDEEFCGRGPAADRLSAEIQQYWTAFARSGSPAGDWPQYCEQGFIKELG